MADDSRTYLPEDSLREVHAPAAAPATKNKAWRAVVLWVALIVMFLTIWQFLTPAEHHSRGRRAAVPCAETTSWPAVAAVGSVVIAGVGFILFLRRLMLGAREQGLVQRGQEPGRMALAHGRSTEAIALFEQTALALANKPLHRNFVRLNVATAQLHAGRLDEAIASYTMADKDAGRFFSESIRTYAAVDLSLTHALNGDLDTAERWAAEADKRVSATNSDRLGYRARLRIAEAIVLIRRGRAAEAVASMREHWLETRHTLTSNAMRSLEVIRALAESQGDMRTQNVVGERLIRVEPVTPGEFAYLGVRWPEMQAFLSAHGLDATPGPSRASAS
jgi:hypothetical protein